ncbi:molybdate ABC transporter permease subunit [Wohlfahrtiimonas populi]|uniref:molybdate ABC transporter permease subunit n=1 Tax=Wohlfahrtiimonas populi TaxID=1940240 RepID=UPI00098D36EB|nr:molybdate ABC transporter permease subunit [Wohlfahrtiimonas populi]
MLESIYPILLLTLKIAGLATLIGSVLGILIGFFLARTDFWGKNLLDTILTLPMVLPPTVLGYYLLTLIGQKSWFGQWLYESFGIRLIFTWQAAVIAATIVAFPLILKPARAAFEDVNREYEQAASMLGISRVAIFFRVTLPLAWRGILSGILLAFARALGEFGATLMVAGATQKTQTLSIAIYRAYNSFDYKTANYLVLLTSAVCIVILMAATFLNPRKPRA